MAENPNSRDRSFEALDFIINVLKEHEQTLDKSIQELALVTERRESSSVPAAKIEKIEQKLDVLQKEVAKLMGYLTTQSKIPSAPSSPLEPTTKTTPTASPPIIQGMPSVVLNCRQWEDFHLLAMHSQTLFFSIKENEKIFQAEAVKGSQIITYTGVLPSFSSILGVWLSQQLGIIRQNVLEGSLEKGK
jgi:hypothetical protein